MKIERGIISSTQLMFLIIGLLEASTLTAAFISGVTKQNTWLVLLVGFTITLFLLLVYIELSKKYPQMNLIEMNSSIYGLYFGKVMSILYIYYFCFLVPANIRIITDFFSTNLFPETDISVFTIAVILVCMYTVRKGIEVIARVGFIIALLTIIISIFISVLTIGNIRLQNFLPLFQINLKELIQGTNVMVSIPFGEIIVFLMIFPYVNDIKQVKKSAFMGLIIGGMFFFTVSLRNISVLGNIGYIQTLPSYQVATFINLGQIITRIEVLVAVVLLFNVFLKVSIFYYAAVLSIAQFFKLESYRPLVIPVGIISLVLAIDMFSSPVEEAYIGANIYPIYAIPFIILFPVVSLTIASIRKST